MCTRPNPTRRALVPVLLVLASPALPAQTIHVWTGVGERPAAAGDVDADGVRL